MTIIAIEEHWTTAGIDHALRAQPEATRDESVILSDRGDLGTRLLDIGDGRVEAMDAAGIDVQILSIAPPGTHGLPAGEAVALLLSGDYPFHLLDAAAVTGFLDTLADRGDREKIAHGNAEALYDLEGP